MSDGSVHLVFPASPEYLILARLALSGLARSTPVDEATLADLKLAVTEACGNAVRHAYADGQGTVSVRFTVTGDLLEMEVADRGAGIHLVPAPDEPADDPGLPESGMGMAIIRAVVDDVDVREGDDGQGTVVTMAKRLTVPSPPPRDAGSLA